jgi:hypothetical protein
VNSLPSEISAIVDTTLKSLEILSIVAGVGVILYRLGQTTQRFEMIGSQQATEISKLAAGQQRIEELMTRVAVQTQRLDNQDQRLVAMERRWDEVRRGEGLIR